MPIHKGLKLTIVSQLEFQVHPEFAHPESSQFTNRSSDLCYNPLLEVANWTPSSATSADSKADRLLGRPSAISVYIPSVPGARFWLRYSIDKEAAKNSPWYYFKLFMNGRHIASWGTHSQTAPSGQVMRGLFEPSDKWNYKHEGTTYKNMGTEMRPFFFAKEEEVRSAANDGGLIEILVFRAKGRKRKMPEPVNWKPQEQYGIIMPSSGLFENPQDAKFYDWHLKDPKHNPFSTFRFHYRSWDSLESLQLIPSNYPRNLLAPSASILSLNGLSRELQAQLQESESEDEALAISPANSSFSSQISDTPWLTTVFDDIPTKPVQNSEKGEAFVTLPKMPHLYSIRNQNMVKSKIEVAIVDLPVSLASSTESPSKGYVERPLPEIPSRISSLRHSRLSRKSSQSSNSPSITPSLLPYLDRDTLSPEPECGIASAVAVTRHSSPVLDMDDTEDNEGIQSPSGYFVSNVENRSQLGTLPRSLSPSKKFSKRAGIIPPPLFSLSNITIRHPRYSSPKTPKTPPEIFSKQSYSPASQAEQPTLIDNMTTLSLTESEWMCRTPSPIKHQKGTLRKKALDWYEKVKGGDGSNRIEPQDSESAGN